MTDEQRIKEWIEIKKKQLPKTALTAGFFGIFVSAWVYMAGFHAVDYSHNMIRMTELTDLCFYTLNKTSPNITLVLPKWEDIGSDFIARDYTFWYIYGHNSQRYGVLGFVFSSLVFMWGYCNTKIKDD